MHRNLLVFACVCVALLSTGCLRSLNTVTVHRDGSATITDTMLFAPRFLAMMNSLGNASEEGQASKISMWSDSTIRSDAADFGPGVVLKEWKEVEIDGMTGYVATYEAPSVNDLVLDGNRGASKVTAGDEGEGSDESESNDPWRMTYAGGVLTIVNPPDEDTTDALVAAPMDEEQTDEELRQTLDMMAGFLRGMRISMRVVVDGPITETNATFVRGSEITLLAMDFDKLVDVWERDPSTFKDFDTMKGASTQSLGAILKAYPEGALVIELQPRVTVGF